MCGILGIYNLNGSPVKESFFNEMGTQINHRGPDGEGSFHQETWICSQDVWQF